MKFPLIVLEGLDFALFYTIKDLESGLEGIDVEENLYKAFDAAGRALNLKAIGVTRGRFAVEVGRVEFGGAEDVPNHQQELVGLLREHLQAIGYPAKEGHELEDLVRLCEEAHKRSI